MSNDPTPEALPEPGKERSLRLPPYWLIFVFLLLILLGYDLWPSLVAPARHSAARQLVESGITVQDFKREMDSRGVAVEDINNMNALLIRYCPRSSLTVGTLNQFNGWLAQNTAWNLNIPSANPSLIVFLDSSTSMPKQF